MNSMGRYGSKKHRFIEIAFWGTRLHTCTIYIYIHKPTGYAQFSTLLVHSCVHGLLCLFCIQTGRPRLVPFSFSNPVSKTFTRFFFMVLERKLCHFFFSRSEASFLCQPVVHIDEQRRENSGSRDQCPLQAAAANRR